MRIVKPYGRSQVRRGANGSTRRTLLRRPEFTEQKDIEAFARSHDELVIAQWISALDKIATKPAGKNDGPTPEQREFRERLGNAAWALLEAKDLLPGLADATRKEHLRRLWRAKVHPYGSTEHKPRRGRPDPSAKGRWYDRFAGGGEIAAVSAEAVAAKIHEHLYGAELPGRDTGLIAARARSIAVNVLRPPARMPNEERTWTDADKQAYAAAGDVAGEIWRQAADRERAIVERNRGKVPRRSGFALRDAALVLYAQHGRLFDGAGIAEARERAPGLFALHQAVKDCYSRILKDHKKSSVARVLPRDMAGLFRLVEAKLDNRDLNALVRLGKVIHYQSSVGVEDSPDNVVANWPADVSSSEYWTSDGQARIKRNEAFVRVWRHVLALAQRTLTDWAHPGAGFDGDILLSGPVQEATGRLFDRANYIRKLDLLFGSRAEFFKGDEVFERSVLKLALEGAAGLRHSSFHFKGLGGFASALAAYPATRPQALAAAKELWATDLRERAQRLRETLRAADLAYFLDEAQGRALLMAVLADTGPAALPLPRFRRMLRRADNAWKTEKDGPGLPAPANRTDFESHPALRCRYVTLKSVYERPFRRWLETRDGTTLNRFIDRAVERATRAARDLNAKDDEERRSVIVARAADLGRLGAKDKVQKFFFDLSAETAAEMRVQRGYASDAEAARAQAEYIEDLKSDVVALAFADYLKESGLDFLRTLPSDAPKPAAPRHDIDKIELPAVASRPDDWQTILYFLVHLVPVEEVGRLLHQMRKWEILATDSEPPSGPALDRVRRIQVVLELYLDMHDAKFEGGAALVGAEAFRDLFESASVFDDVFPKQPGADDERRAPKRGLREIMRFGHRPALQPIFARHTVSAREVEEFRAMEWPVDGTSEIAHRQDRRERLHEAWTEKKKEFVGADLRDYVEVLREVVEHRHRAAHVTLTNHIRLHRLLMAVLGRLVDYSGLWERDLYFVAVAEIHRGGRRPADVFTVEGIERLRQGRIVDAVRGLDPTLRDRLLRHFTDWDGSVRIRNSFAHFNMLQPKSLPVDLTACVNDARTLMAYDRKLRNAVAQSVKELMAREGLDIDWTMGAEHRLGAATLSTRQASHLGDKRLFERQAPGDRRPRKHLIRENLHGARFVDMAAALFAGRRRDPREISVLDLLLDRIDWAPASMKNRPPHGGNRWQNPRGRGWERGNFGPRRQ